jgi:uncharacterized glyoxalase superfamily protein PhnB
VTVPETEARSISSRVTVGADPQTAFSVFTDEIDLWWARGPINFYDAGRAIGMRCEPGVGGRLLELYAEDASDALELGRITDWEPGRRLRWNSSVDDVTVEVRFEPVTDGTEVIVTATIPAGGRDDGGTAWVRVVPRWLGAWCARRETAPHVPSDTNRLGLAVYYAEPAAAAAWLADAFGFSTAYEHQSEEYDHAWIEFHVGNSSIMVFPLTGDIPERSAVVTHVPWVFVDDLDAHFEHARSHGARILNGIHQRGYRAYLAADCEGNHWTFAQARPTMDG